MKKLFLIVAFVVTTLTVNAQQQDQILYGNVQYDGYYNIKKGAFWKVRPEAKAIYEGGYPEGYSVYKLKQDYFVRFAKGNYSAKTRNYIVFPAGTKVYKNNLTGEFFAAICGNKIVFLKPVNQVIIKQSEPKTVYRDRIVRDTVYQTKTRTVVKEVEQELDDCTKAALGLQKIQMMYDGHQIKRRQAKALLLQLKQQFPECSMNFKLHYRNTGAKILTNVGSGIVGIGLGYLLGKNSSKGGGQVIQQQQDWFIPGKQEGTPDPANDGGNGFKGGHSAIFANH